MDFFNELPITVEQQIAHQREPYIENISLLFGTNTEALPNTFILSNLNPYGTLTIVKGTKIRVVLFNSFDVTSTLTLTIGAVEFTINNDYVLKNNSFYVLECTNNDEINGHEFKIIDSQEYPVDPIYYEYNTVYNCILSAIDTATKFIGHTLILEHVTVTTDVVEDDEIAVTAEEKLAIYVANNEIISNIIYTEDSEGVITQVDFDIGYTKENFPPRLKRGIMNNATTLYKSLGGLISKDNGITMDLDDVSKNIYLDYRGYKKI